jgi:AcrR family transcriptional regulator
MTSARHTPKQMRGMARVHTLLAAAEAVFAEVGYDGASTTLIAQRANTAIGSLYDFFPNKAAIARQLVLQYLTDLETLFAAILTEELASLRAEDMIDRILDPLLEYQRAHPGFHALMTRPLDDAQLTRQRDTVEERLVAWTAGVMARRLPEQDRATAFRVSRVCIRTTQGLNQLANVHQPPDRAVIADLKLMLRSYLEAVAELRMGGER